MKSTSTIVIAALAVVVNLVASSGPVSAAGSGVSSVDYRSGLYPTLMCITSLPHASSFNMVSVVDCVTRLMPTGTDNHITFTLKNAETVNERGHVINSYLASGKWQIDNKDVPNINNMAFDGKNRLIFSAVGQYGSGVEGSFEIYESGRTVATVSFEIPVWGGNLLDVRLTDHSFVCNSQGMTAHGSPSVEITCYKQNPNQP